LDDENITIIKVSVLFLFLLFLKKKRSKGNIEILKTFTQC